MQIQAVVARRTQQVDGIWAYTEHLVRALNANGEDARTTSPTRRPLRTDVTLVQYNPFSYARWGVAPGLIIWALAQRWSRSSRLLVLMVHEPYVAVVDTRSCLMATWQRLQLVLLRLVAQRVLAPSADQAGRCGTRFRSPRVVPVGSNLPDARASRDAARQLIGAGEEDVVLVTFAASPAGHRQELVAAAFKAVFAHSGSCVLLVLGANNRPPASLPPDFRIVRPGHLEDAELAARLAAGDIFLAPFVDGVSTRRTTLMAALQHALPVIATVTSKSDDVLVQSPGIVGVPADCAEDFARATARLATNPRERRDRGTAARALFEREFTWARIVERLLREIS